MLKIPKRHLFLLAGLLWSFAGYQIMHIGASVIPQQHWPLFCILFSAGIILFIFLRFIFLKMVRKHTRRIYAYQENRQPFYCFFDKSSYIIMVFMMSGGILLRKGNLLPSWIIAFFYTGLGTALLISGLLYLVQWIRYQEEQPSVQSTH